MENWLFWGLNLGNLKQCMMIMLVLTSSSSAWTLCSLLHISSLINICNFYSFWATGMVLTSKWGRILQEIHCQCQIWLKWSAAGRRPANFHKRNYLLSVNTTDFEKTTIQAHSALSAPHRVPGQAGAQHVGGEHPGRVQQRGHAAQAAALTRLHGLRDVDTAATISWHSESSRRVTHLTAGTAMPTALPDMTLNTSTISWLLARLARPAQWSLDIWLLDI